MHHRFHARGHRAGRAGGQFRGLITGRRRKKHQIRCEQAREGRCLLVDCLTLWLTNLLMLDDAERLAAEREALLECLASLPGEIIFVSNETGMGVVPLGELTRRYVDEAGWLHQALAERCQRVVLTVAGLPLTLKGSAL